MPESWTIQHFSLSLPVGTDRSNVPNLLRHLADQLEAFGPVEIQDVTFGAEATATGDVHHFTVYFHPPEPANAHRPLDSE